MSLFVTAAVVAPACVSNTEDGSILITQASAPQTGCVNMSTVGEAAISHGRLSSMVPTNYTIVVQMHSRLTSTTAAGSDLQHTIITTGANVDLTFPNSTLFTTAELADLKTQGLTHFRSLFTISISPNDGISDGAFELIPRGLYDQIYAKAPEAHMPAGTPFELEVLATATVTGTVSGNEVSSLPFAFPVTIANDNGMVDLPAPGTCPLPAGTTVLIGNACGQAQDEPVTCCDTGSSLMCPATVAAMATP